MLQKIQQTIKHSAIYTLPSIASQFIGVILVPIYTKIFSPADYGVIEILNVLSFLIKLTVALEITQAIARYLPGSDKQSRIRYFSTSFILTLFVFIIFIFLFFLFQTKLLK